MHWALNQPPALSGSYTEGSSEIHRRFGADIQNHSCDKGSRVSWGPVTAWGWSPDACRHTRGRLCAHSINTGICLCKLIFNLLPTWCWALDVTQWKAELDCPKSTYKFTSIHRRVLQQEAMTSDVVLRLQVLNQGRRPQHLLPSAKPLPLAWLCCHPPYFNTPGGSGSSFWL